MAVDDDADLAETGASPQKQDGSSDGVDLDKLKKEAEIRKLEAETAALQPKAWFRSEWFWKAVAGGIIAVPLMWFFFEKIVVPVSNTKSINERWEDAKKRDDLEVEKRRLENVEQDLDKEREKLKAVQQALEELKVAARLTEEQKAALEARSLNIREERQGLLEHLQTVKGAYARCEERLDEYHHSRFSRSGRQLKALQKDFAMLKSSWRNVKMVDKELQARRASTTLRAVQLSILSANTAAPQGLDKPAVAEASRPEGGARHY